MAKPASPPGKQIGVMLEGERDDAGVFRQTASNQVEGVGGVSGDDNGVVRARADEASQATCDLKPAPRCTLAYQGRNSAIASATSRSAGALAA
jgi:hypothetical protein